MNWFHRIHDWLFQAYPPKPQVDDDEKVEGREFPSGEFWAVPRHDGYSGVRRRGDAEDTDVTF